MYGVLKLIMLLVQCTLLLWKISYPYQQRQMVWNLPSTHQPALVIINSEPVFDLIHPFTWLFWSKCQGIVCKYFGSMVLFAVFWNSKYSTLIGYKILELGGSYNSSPTFRLVQDFSLWSFLRSNYLPLEYPSCGKLINLKYQFSC